MNKKSIKYLKLFVTLAIIALLVWFLVIRPLTVFNKYERQMEEAGKRYFELNKSELPTGTRLATVSMQTLYHKAFLKEDFFIPYTEEPCDLKNSWVKVKRVNGEYKYYTYLKCGAMESSIDNKGPEIKLNGSKEMTINLGEDFKDPGVKSVYDATDGKLDVKTVTVKSKNLDTSKVGTYEVTYTALDSLKNKSTVTRTVKVVSKLKNAVLLETNKKGYYQGADPANHIILSGMMFRIIGVDGDNVKLIALEDVANVNYEGINSWLNYYMEHFNEQSKKLLVKNKYCNMDITDATINETSCKSVTESQYAYLPSITDINKSKDENGKSFLYPLTLSWTANKKSSDTAFATRYMMFGNVTHTNYYADKTYNNYGVRPVITVKGSTLLKGGDGTLDNPYTFGETKKGTADEPINKRYPGEYITYGGILWRIVETSKDGTTKIISLDNISKDGQAITTSYETTNTVKQYNPTQKGNIGYFINNRVSEYIDTSYFVNKKIEVPIYTADIAYKKETSTKKYEVKLSAPNTYEMFSAQATTDIKYKSYWLINSSKKQYYKGAVTDAGVVLSKEVSDMDAFGIRVVGNLHKNVMITKGKGTLKEPYNITK